MNVEEHGEFRAHERFLKGLLENELQKTNHRGNSGPRSSKTFLMCPNEEKLSTEDQS